VTSGEDRNARPLIRTLKLADPNHFRPRSWYLDMHHTALSHVYAIVEGIDPFWHVISVSTEGRVIEVSEDEFDEPKRR
jgi:hypothetical protein